MMRINYGSRAERFAMRPPEKDRPINIPEGAVRSGKTWCLHPKALYSCAYPVGGRKLFTGVSKQSVYNNVLTDLFDLVGPRNYCYNRSTGHLKLYGTEWLLVGLVKQQTRAGRGSAQPCRSGPRPHCPGPACPLRSVSRLWRYRYAAIEMYFSAKHIPG